MIIQTRQFIMSGLFVMHSIRKGGELNLWDFN